MRQQAEDAVRAWADEAGVPITPGTRRGEFVVELPGEAKLRTGVSILVTERALSVSAFVMRRPDENHEAFYRWMLRRNTRLPGVAFALDQLGDVYLTGRLPIQGVTPGTLDDLLGALLTASDGSFNELLALGFLSSMRREWAWRVQRGESTRNLEAFRHLLDDEGAG
ncbi:YbjN domain-containing protein [Kineosporia sp. J2-2]|uniref:YbjN domain-containing protein n=1 Tax=Kineosporia corallincola TaxID=2835133 RepID=A0ABS5T9X4_9ACTN|nr:YbjN domain-containing protein [Kineosporia corallincola]MBT0767663.1 YbjN domain-containing protein [Kineosporia corallincola]